MDRVDEPHLINSSAEQMRALLWPMLDNKFLKHPGMGFKLLLPVELYYYVKREEREFYERARLHPDIAADQCYIDAYCLNLIRKPWTFDVCPMENQFGDITSDLGAGLICGMGYAPSGDIGDDHALAG